jgi:hypothetical protein
MRANIIVCLLAAGFLGCLKVLDLRRGVSSQEKHSLGNEISTNDQVVGPDAYKVAVLVSVGLAILSLCF